MHPRLSAIALSTCLALSVPAAASAAPIFIDFEAFAEGEVPTGLDVTFSNALVLTSGAIGGSLNDFDFPPRSDFNVAYDDAGPMTLQFLTPIVSFSGFFTYNSQLTLTAFKDGVVVGIASSSATQNFVSAGGTGNELLSLFSAGGITSLEIFGSATGGSFVMDDIEFEAAQVTDPTPVPEPSTSLLLGLGGLALGVRRLTARRRLTSAA